MYSCSPPILFLSHVFKNRGGERFCFAVSFIILIRLVLYCILCASAEKSCCISILISLLKPIRKFITFQGKSPSEFHYGYPWHSSGGTQNCIVVDVRARRTEFQFFFKGGRTAKLSCWTTLVKPIFMIIHLLYLSILRKCS